MRLLDRAPKGALGAGLCFALLALSAAACGSSAPAGASRSTGAGEAAATGGFFGALLPAETAHDFTLTDAAGRATSTRGYRGRVVVLAFAGTRCGAPCTVIGDQVRGALDQLSEEVPVLIVSVDPAADSAAAIARFLARTSLIGRARYLSGAPAQIRSAWQPYHVPAPAAGSAIFERFAPVFLLDSHGRARVEYTLEQLTPEGLAHDIRALARG